MDERITWQMEQMEKQMDEQVEQMKWQMDDPMSWHMHHTRPSHVSLAHTPGRPHSHPNPVW